MCCVLPLQGVKEDMLVLQKNLDSMNSISSCMLEEAEESYGEVIREQVRQINEQWAGVVQLANRQHSDLSEADDATQALLDRMVQAEEWMDVIHRQHLAREYTVHSLEELQQLNKTFQVGNHYSSLKSSWTVACWIIFEQLDFYWYLVKRWCINLNARFT